MHPLYWHWWAIGLALMAVEAFFPGAFFLWLGLAALVVGVVLLPLPGLGLELQVALFAVAAVGSILIGRQLRGARRGAVVDSGLNDRARRYAGRTFTLDAAIVNGIGSMRVDDGQWRIAGPDLPAGSCVRVVAVDGATLTVEKVN